MISPRLFAKPAANLIPTYSQHSSAKIAFLVHGKIGQLPEASCIAKEKEDELLKKHLESKGYEVSYEVWNDPTVDWKKFDLIYHANTEDFIEHISEFRNFFARLKSEKIPLLNTADQILFSADKSYLADLGKLGHYVVPTELVPQNSQKSLQSILEEKSWDKVVVKGTVAGWGSDNWKSSLSDSITHQSRFQELNQRMPILIQPFIAEIEHGEYSLIFFDGDHSHSILKKPASGEYKIHKKYGGKHCETKAPEHAIASAKNLIDSLHPTPVKARIDGVMKDGKFMIMEVELGDPGLYFGEVQEPQEPTKKLAQALEAHIPQEKIPFQALRA